MNCRTVEQELSSYLDGELPVTRAARLEAHLRTCPHCRNELQAMSGIAGQIRAASQEVRVSADFDQRVLRSVGYYQVTGGYARRRDLTKPLTVLAMILLALLGLIRHYFSQPLGPPLRAPQPAAAVVAPGPPPTPIPVQHERELERH